MLLIKFLVAAIGASTPLLFGTVGEICAEKVGHLNLGVEGMMSIGACAGFMVGMQTDSFLLALLAAFVAGVLSALIYAVLTVTFLADDRDLIAVFGVLEVYKDHNGQNQCNDPAHLHAQDLGQRDIG